MPTVVHRPTLGDNIQPAAEILLLQLGTNSRPHSRHSETTDPGPMRVLGAKPGAAAFCHKQSLTVQTLNQPQFPVLCRLCLTNLLFELIGRKPA